MHHVASAMETSFSSRTHMKVRNLNRTTLKVCCKSPVAGSLLYNSIDLSSLSYHSTKGASANRRQNGKWCSYGVHPPIPMLS